jgi:hypothetical protein
MNYVPTVSLTTETLSQLQYGTLTFQPGQWLKMPGSTYCSRFVGRSKAGVVWILWSQGEPTQNRNFYRQREVLKNDKEAD